MKIHTSRPLAIALIIVGLLLFSTAIIADTPINYFSGTVLTLLGILTLFQPTLDITHDFVHVKSPVGIKIASYPVRFPGDLAISNNKLWHVPTQRKILSVGFGIHKPDLARLQYVLSGGYTAPSHHRSVHSPAQSHQATGYQHGYQQQAPNTPPIHEPHNPGQAPSQWQATTPPLDTTRFQPPHQQ